MSTRDNNVTQSETVQSSSVAMRYDNVKNKTTKKKRPVFDFRVDNFRLSL